MRRTIRNITIGFTALLVIGCGQNKTEEQIAEIQKQLTIEGDTTIYGLACDGCTDSLLVFLPLDGGDPDTFDIIDAWQEHRVFGRLRIGDQLAVILNPDSLAEVLMVINLNRLAGQWSYMVTPTLRNLSRPLPDSIRQRLLAPKEYSFRLKRDGTALTLGGQRQKTSDDRRPVDFPDLKRYKEWHLYNGHLILSTGKENDTATILMLRHDSLILSFADHDQHYYRKKSD